MRLLFGILTLFLILGCRKQTMLKKVEGTWTQYKFLGEDGVFHEVNATFVFEKGEVDQWLPLTIYSATDTVTYLYQPSSIQHNIRVKNSIDQTEINWLIEDVDKESMVLHNPTGILFFNKK